MINKIFSSLLRALPENNRLERIWKLAQVDFKKRYYNDKFGLIWALINPLAQVFVYYFVFTYIFEKSTESIDNYALFLFSGIIFWTFFKEGSQKGMKILFSKRYLIENIQLNKLDLYIANSLSTLMGFCFNLFVFVSFSVFWGIEYSFQLLYLPLLVMITGLIALGFGMCLSILFIFFKDISHLMDIVYLFGFWSSGIFFRGELFVEIFPPLLYINPFVGIIINARNLLIFNNSIDFYLLMINFVSGLIIYLIGLLLLKKYASYAYERF